MKLSSALLAASLGLAVGHEDIPIPRIVGGRRFLTELKRRGGEPSPFVAGREPTIATEHAHHDERGELKERQNTSGQCGGKFGNCAAGYCCSSAGWCGNTEEYCAAPDCQINYGPGCDANQKPSGTDTSAISRPKLGSVPYGGAGIYDCVNPGDIAITFDDGPYNYTNDLLNIFKTYNAHATFFITGNNLGKGKINDPSTPWPAVIKRMIAEGHQVASHTWSHQNASQLTDTQMTNQIVWNEIAFNSILGFFPTYMRPPYSICESKCQTILSNLGYHITYFDLDTEGYLHDDPTQIQTSKNIWDKAINNASPSSSSFLQIEHDIHYQTVYNLTEYTLKSLAAHGFRSVTVGQCLGDDPANWYRAGSGSVPSYTFTQSATASKTGSSGASSATSGLKVSVDGSCGSGVTCQGSTFGNCCSTYGFCGSTADYCGAGCNSAFGTCSSTGSSTTSITTTTAAQATSIRTSTAATASATSGLKVSQDGTCANGQTCQGSQWGNCCSTYGYCGNTADYCGAGCQSGFGTCSIVSVSSASPSIGSTSLRSTSVVTSSTGKVTSSSSSSPSTSSRPLSLSSSTSTSTATVKTSTTTSSTSKSAAPTLKVSTDGSCGTGVTCQGSKYGNCCSQYGWCGKTKAYCGTGCNSGFGTCT